jgi:hypothetical protein
VFTVVLLLSFAQDNHLGSRLLGTFMVIGEALSKFLI